MLPVVHSSLHLLQFETSSQAAGLLWLSKLLPTSWWLQADHLYASLFHPRRKIDEQKSPELWVFLLLWNIQIETAFTVRINLVTLQLGLEVRVPAITSCRTKPERSVIKLWKIDHLQLLSHNFTNLFWVWPAEFRLQCSISHHFGSQIAV